MPPTLAPELEKCIEKDKITAVKKTAAFVQGLRDQSIDLSRKFDRLLDTYLAQDLERGDYLDKRSKIVSEKKSVEEQIARLERNATSWLEPVKEWIQQALLLGSAA